MSPGEVTLTCRISLTHSLGSPSRTLFLCRDKPKSHTPYYRLVSSLPALPKHIPHHGTPRCQGSRSIHVGPQLTCHSDTLRELNTPYTYLFVDSWYIHRQDPRTRRNSLFTEQNEAQAIGIVWCCAALHGAPYIEVRSR